LLFEVARPELFDAVITNGRGEVEAIDVKHKPARTSWIWGAFKLPTAELARLRALWDERDRRDQYFGTLVNAYIERGGRALGVRAGEAYVDVGTLNGYREALRVLGTKL
jgi:tRNA (mo5U34)-methyltransferase